MQTGHLYIHAPNIHQGGGKTLLYSIIESLDGEKVVVLILDSRMQIPEYINTSINIKLVKKSMLHRIWIEIWLAKEVTRDDVVLCFGNLPPIFKLTAYTVVYVQNRYLVEKIALTGFSLWQRFRISIERLWFSNRKAVADQFVVQSKTMKMLLEKKLDGKIPVIAIPFVGNAHKDLIKLAEEKKPKIKFDFIYVASGEPHKNHLTLIEAWCILALEGVRPSLCLTLSSDVSDELCREINLNCKKFNLNLVNLGVLRHEEIISAYGNSNALIYPSRLESFGLPLYEAKQMGLKILAAELDYVRDMLDPEQTFDPESAVSISRAVKRSLGIAENALPILSAGKFIELISELGS